MTGRQIIKGLGIGLIFLTSCYYDNEETLYPQGTCITTNMSYAADINPILSQNCFVCHSTAANNGNVILEGHTKLKVYVNSGQLLGAIRHESGYSFMPKGSPMLRDCDIAKIEQWVLDGSPNN